MTSAREVLVAALEDLDAAKVPDDLRVVAFSKLFEYRANAHQSGAADQRQVTNQPMSGPPDVGGGGNDDALAAVGVRVGVSRDTVAEVYDARDGNVELIIPVGKLSNKVASATKEIALLVAGGRQAAGTEEWTSLDVIRSACSDFKRLDVGNFAKTIRSMETVFNFRKESERKSVVKLAKPGWENYGQLVRQLGGEG